MQDVTLEVTLKLQGPILTHSTAPGASYLSSPFARNREGRYCFPGSLVKGRLREAWTELESAAGNFLQTRCGLTMKQLLGEVSGNQQNNAASTAPKRSRLYFDNFEDRREGTVEPGLERARYRIKLDETRGSVSKGAYQVIEAPYAAGEEVSFIGRIRFRTSDADRAEKIRECIQIGLRWVTSLGANCNVGFGRLLDAQVKHATPSAKATAKDVAATGAESWELIITPESPFCITRRRVADNLFESEAIIPGAVLKGSIAHTLCTLRGDSPDGEIVAGYDPTRPELCANFHLIRLTHAFPAQAGQQSRPVAPPLSLVKAHGKLYDVALFDKPILIGDQKANNQTEWIAPAFAIDWKDDSDVRQTEFGWAKPKRELRVRTAIDAERRKAKDEQLFAYEMIAPDETDWHASVDLSAIADSATRRKVEQQLLGLLAHGLQGFSKTKTQVKVELNAAGSILPKCPSNRAPQINPQTQEHLWIVTIQTPAILCEPQSVNQNKLFAAYQEVWEQLSSSALQLKHFFAQQSLSGGYYLYRRFMKFDAYYPYFLTEPGSVFVLAARQGEEAKAQDCIDDWLAHGLPLPAWAITEYQRDGLPGDDWRNCPYLREGGYGEIAVNLAVHFDLTHQPQEVKQL